MELRGFRLESSSLEDERTVFEAFGIIDGTVSVRYRELLRFLAVHIRKNGSSVPSSKYEKPNCKHLTEPEPAKYHCVWKRNNAPPHIKTVHLIDCASCNEQEYTKPTNYAERQIRNIIEEQKNEQTTPTPVPATVVKKAPPKIEVTENSVTVGQLSFDIVQNWTPVLQSDNSKRCPFTGDSVFNNDCKTCKTSNQNMFSACVQVFWQAQKKQTLFSNAPTPTIPNTQKE